MVGVKSSSYAHWTFLCLSAFAGQLFVQPIVHTTKAADNRPNIILIMCDDLGFSDLGCYGSNIRTPNLDQLAAEGLRFTQFYNCGLCGPTRAALLTGQYPRLRSHSRARSAPEDGYLKTGMITVAQLLRSEGYNTALIGKWQHRSHPMEKGFDYYYGLRSGCCNYFNPARPDPLFYGGRKRTFLQGRTAIETFPDDYYVTDAFTDDTVAVLRRYSKEDKPFFLHICYTAPHFPLHAKPEDIAKYQGQYDSGYRSLRAQRHKRQIELGIVDPSWALSAADQRLDDWLYDHDIPLWENIIDSKRERRRMEVYAAMVDCMDQGIGRIMRSLKELGIDNHTLVMFLSDNGGCASEPSDQKGWREYNRNLPGAADTYDFCGPGWGWAQNTPFRRYKAWLHEGGIATPLIVRWPKMVRKNTITRQPGHVIDIVPTCLEAAKAEFPTEFRGQRLLPLEGKSLMPVFRGKEDVGKRIICWYLLGNRAVRQGQWKLVWGVARQVWELYDLKADRTETHDLSEQHSERVEQMARMWNEWAKEIDLEAYVLDSAEGKTE